MNRTTDEHDGWRLQQEAAWAFKLREYETAFDLYVRAEQDFRRRFSTPRDRVYFMQSWQLTCLEKLLETNPNFLEIYHSKTDAFLQEWSEETISKRIHPTRVPEALDIRSFRISYLTVSRDFSDAYSVEKGGDLERARAILEAVIRRATSSDDQEADAVCAIARSKIEMLSVRRELRKGPKQRNSKTMLSGYFRAAKASFIPVRSRSRQRTRLAAYRALFLSDALKYRAFDLLREMHAPEMSLGKAKRYLARAVKYAESAASLEAFAENHACYLRYWHELVTERVYLLAFMKHGMKSDFDAAAQAWQSSLQAAEQICGERGEESLFPNRFYCLDDLKLERQFLGAAKAFREQQWLDCIRLLEEWREKLPAEYAWTWRDSNVYIRLLGARTIQAVNADDQEVIRSAITDLMNVSDSEPCGSAARYFAEEVANLGEKKKNKELFDLTLKSLAEYFVPDSWVDSDQPAEDVDLLASLPTILHQRLRTSLPATNTEVERAKRLVSGALETLLGFMCDYYAQLVTPDNPVPRTDIGELIDLCREFPFGLAQNRKFQEAIETLGTSIADLRSADSAARYAAAYSKALDTVRYLIQFMPVIAERGGPHSLDHETAKLS